MRRAIALLGLAVALGAAAPGCAGTDTKEDRPAPIVAKTPQEDSPAEEGTTPPFSKPRAKVPPSSAGLKQENESIFHQTQPH